jgi:predicted nucleic acid-binding protein
LPLTYRDLHNSRQFRDEQGLMTNDSIIVAVMKREKIQFLATNDADFERVPGIAVRTPL